jgi:hypothetical protein
LDLASGGNEGESSTLAVGHPQCMLRVAPDGFHLFLLAVIPADVKRPFRKMRGILVDWAEKPLSSDLYRLIEND